MRCSKNTAALGSPSTITAILPPLSNDQNHLPTHGWSTPHSFTQTEEASFGIAELNCCEGISYLGSILIQTNIAVWAAHFNGLQPRLPAREQKVIYLMTYAPLTAPEDLKVLIRVGIAKLCPTALSMSSIRQFSFAWHQENPALEGTTSWRGSKLPRGHTCASWMYYLPN